MTGRDQSPEPVSDVECPTCGGPTEDGHALEGWPFEWEVASKLRAELATAREENDLQRKSYIDQVTRAERAEAREARLLTVHDQNTSLRAALERYRTTYRDAAQAHHEWAADPIYGCEHCARVTAYREALECISGLHDLPVKVAADVAYRVLASTEEGAALADEGGNE